MNRGNFTAKDSFPVSTQTYDFIQQMAQLAGKLAHLGGANYILSGCKVKGTQVSAGLIVINGEILPFEAGVLSDKISIQEIKEADNAFGVDYPEAYIHRTAKFSADGEYLWDNFVQVLTNLELQKKINDITGDVPGITKGWAGFESRIPKDYMLCDGRQLEVDEYPELFQNIGTTYGGDGTKFFNIPNHKKLFVAGYDPNNPDYSMGSTGGADEVILDIKQIPRHRHVYTDDTNAQGKFPSVEAGFPASIGGTNVLESSGSSTGKGTVYGTNHVGGNEDGTTEPHENRPKFIVEAKIIKVK